MLAAVLVSSVSQRIDGSEFRPVFVLLDICGTHQPRQSADSKCAACLLGDGFCGGKSVRAALLLKWWAAGTAWPALLILPWSIGYQRSAVRGLPCFEKDDIKFLRCETAGAFTGYRYEIFTNSGICRHGVVGICGIWPSLL